jgi:starch synthase (maltosyl-transferring)
MQDTPQRAGTGPSIDASASIDKRRANLPQAGPRIVIEDIAPSVDGGKFPIKRVVGDVLGVEADIFSDGHEELAAALFVRSPGTSTWAEMPMQPLGNDRWAGSFILSEIGTWHYSIAAWRDPFRIWLGDVAKKQAAGQALDVEMLEGFHLARSIADRVEGNHSDRIELDRLLKVIDPSAGGELTTAQRVALLKAPEFRRIISRAACRRDHTRSPDNEVWAERRKAAFSSWYELVPRSQSKIPGRHGTFDDVIERLPDLRDLGFDVLYLPPIHPIGRVNRKGRNNSLRAQPDDPGSPYAIGSSEGGHDAIHPELGTFSDFVRLVTAAKDHGMEIALDFAVQCAPDHPWIREHPEWFEWRPDGSIKFAENPPKKYEDIVSVSFYGAAFPSLWFALRDIVLFWIGQGVSIFRVDNPHTKPFPFWQWLIAEVRSGHPGVIFLSEAFTRPKIMRHLAKLGFTQSYSYFTWRNTKKELTDYLLELAHGRSREYMRPNFFTNTPDINPYYLQTSGRPGISSTAVPGSYTRFQLRHLQRL